MIKSNSLYILIFVCFYNYQWTCAQTEPFKGGNGRGDFSTNSIIYYISGQDPNIAYYGGYGRGDFKNTSSIIYFNGTTSNILYPGGDGRGDVKSNSSLLFFNGSSANLFYPGGNGRGDHKSNSSLLFFNGSSANLLYPGGNGKGDIVSKSNIIFLTGELANVLFQGGNGRGDVFALRSLGIFPGGNVSLSVKVYIEGYYIGSGLMRAVIDPLNSPTICDNVTVELHNAVSPYNLAYSFNQSINTSSVGDYTFPSAVLNHSYYIVLKHRNALETWSASPFLFNSSENDYSFIDLITKAYGSNMRDLGDGNFAMFSGDISDANLGVGHQDGIIESQDYSDMENAVYSILQGYLFEDITGDGVVESEDYSIMENNVYFTRLAARP